MKRQLTKRQTQVLQAIVNYFNEKGFMPSIRDLQGILGISSLRGVTIHLDALVKKGWIERERTSRSIRLLNSDTSAKSRQIPLLGSIRAGEPIFAQNSIETYISFPDTIIASNVEDLFALNVKGDSMMGDGILDGDIIIVRSQPIADDGEIVAALIEDEATVKRLDKRSKPMRLIASNPSYKPIELSNGNTRILGKVIGLIRSYKRS